jgi:hypothetical protein
VGLLPVVSPRFRIANVVSGDTSEMTMKRFAIRNILAVLAVAAVALVTVACPEKGPAEKAGEKIDKAVDKTKDAAKDAKDAAKDATK